MSCNFVLASSSKYRLDLLKNINLEPELTVSPDVDECELKSELPTTYVKRIAKAKLLKGVEMQPNKVVLSVDTIAVCGRTILHKTYNYDCAYKALKKISGRRHRVYTCIALYSLREQCVKLSTVLTVVQFKRLSDMDLDNYLRSREWEGKAGCYSIQGKASIFISWIRGSFYNVVGLPIYEVHKLLESENVGSIFI